MRYLWVLMAGVVASAAIGFAMLSSPRVVALDLRAFYCAGQAVRTHRDPYRTVSLQQCERDTGEAYRARLHSATLPAPQPPYVLAVFAIISTLPFALAKSVLGALLGVALFFTLAGFTRLTSLSAPAVFAVLGTSLVAFGLALGQLVPLFMLALCACAFSLKERRPRWAGVAAALTLIEPHLGVPVCIAVFLWERGARVALILTGGALGLAGLLASGAYANGEYLTTVLPLHALSEIDSDGQLSLSAILHALGTSSRDAMIFGMLSYVAAGIAGVLLARTASARFSAPEYVAAVPAAAAVIGGTFVHSTDIVAAIPLAALLLRDTAHRAFFVTVIILLQVTWTVQSLALDEMIGWFALSAIAAGYVAYACGGIRIGFACVLAAALFALLLASNAAYVRDEHAYIAAPRAAAVIDDRYPQASWSGLIESSSATRSPVSWMMRAPTWSALLMLFGACAALPAARKRQVRANIGAPAADFLIL